MRTVRRLLYSETVSAVAFATLAFLALFFFIDVVDELDDVGKRGWGIGQALLVCLLQAPGHFYELFPITVLIGTIYALSRLAQSSEFTILRTGGLGPGRALGLLASLGLLFSALTFVVGDFIAPWCDQQAALMHARANGSVSLGRNGTWLRDSRGAADGEHRFSVNVGLADPNGVFQQVRIFEFGPQGQLVQRIEAQRAEVRERGLWILHDVSVLRWKFGAPGEATVREDERLASMEWPSGLSAQVVTAATRPLKTMSTASLFTYMAHLASHEQAAQRYEIQFWKKALYPFACLVMMGLALPFAYLRSRAGGVGLKVFGGIMLGISFVLINNVAGHLGLLRDWTPWVAAAVPSLLYLLMSLAAFSWLVRYR